MTRTIEMKPMPPLGQATPRAEPPTTPEERVPEMSPIEAPRPPPRVADLPEKWREDYRRCWENRSALPDAVTCGMELERALAHESHVTITAEALRLTVLLKESEAHVCDLLATVENLRKANSELARAALAPEPKGVEALRLAVKLVTGNDYFFSTRAGGEATADDCRDILWQKLCAAVDSNDSLKQCVHLLVGEYPRVTYREDAMEVTACASLGHGRSIACVDTGPHNALLRLIGVLVNRAAVR